MHFPALKPRHTENYTVGEMISEQIPKVGFDSSCPLKQVLDIMFWAVEISI